MTMADGSSRVSTLTTKSGAVIGRLGTIEEVDGLRSASIDLEGIDAQLLELFSRFEETVNGQMFSFLDEIEGEIEALGVCWHKSGEPPQIVYDLQIFPTNSVVSFRLEPGS
jgi:hypothetical protein